MKASAIISPRAAAALSIGQLVCMLGYANQYTKPFNEISGVITEFQNALACAGRVFEFLSEEEEEDDSLLPSLKTADGSVKLCDVSFSYDKSRQLIKKLNLNILPGQRVAIVGPTGCGKSTLINLLMRFYDVDSGSIIVSGRNIKEITRGSLR